MSNPRERRLFLALVVSATLATIFFFTTIYYSGKIGCPVHPDNTTTTTTTTSTPTTSTPKPAPSTKSPTTTSTTSPITSSTTQTQPTSSHKPSTSTHTPSTSTTLKTTTTSTTTDQTTEIPFTTVTLVHKKQLEGQDLDYQNPDEDRKRGSSI